MHRQQAWLRGDQSFSPWPFGTRPLTRSFRIHPQPVSPEDTYEKSGDAWDLPTDGLESTHTPEWEFRRLSPVRLNSSKGPAFRSSLVMLSDW